MRTGHHATRAAPPRGRTSGTAFHHHETMAISASKKEVWSSRVSMYLDKEHVAIEALCNRDYEGEIKAAGDTVRIFTVGAVTVEDYDGSLTAPADLTDAEKTLLIDQKKAFNFKVEDTDQQESVLALVDQGSQRAAYAIADTRDSYILGLHAGVSTSAPDNTYGDSTTGIEVGGGSGEVNALDVMYELGQRLDDAAVSSQNRRIVVPPWFARRLKLELGGKNSALGDTVTVSGLIGEIDGVKIYKSNNVANDAGTEYKIMMGLPVITFADTISKIETYRIESAFATGVKGLYVYGAKMVTPGALALATCNIAAGILTP